jgi:hypothetical protein
VLHLSEWEAWNRIVAGQVARRFPILLDMLEEGSINITGIKLLGPHLTPENHRSVLQEARWKCKLAISEIVARLHPQPDVPTAIIPIPQFAAGPDARTETSSHTAPRLRRPFRRRCRYHLHRPLLGHTVPAGDDDAILNRALTVLIDKLGREKFAQTDRPRSGRPPDPHEQAARYGADSFSDEVPEQ